MSRQPSTMRTVAAAAVAAFAPCLADAALAIRNTPRSALTAAVVTTKQSDEADRISGTLQSAAEALKFKSLETCTAAYKKLKHRRCGEDEEAEWDVLDGGTVRSLSHGWSWKSRKDLKHDEDGNQIIVKQAPMKLEHHILYQPPMSYTGVPDSHRGWDYRHHGDDWMALGNCGGTDQSPVDLKRHVDTKGLTKYVMWFDYYVDPNLNSSHSAILQNDGHGLRYLVQPNGIDLGFVKVGSEEYTASEYMFHTPSEHSIDGAIFQAELQIYNRAKTGGLVAIAMFFKEGKSNPFLAAMMKSMHGEAPRWTMKNGTARGRLRGDIPDAFDLEKLLPQGNAARERAFFNYRGSLTQPPCTGGVDWWVLSSPIQASRAELRFVKRAIYGSRSTSHGNARASMPLGGRQVMSGLVGFQHAVKDRSVPGWATLDEAVVQQVPSGDEPWNPDSGTQNGKPPPKADVDDETADEDNAKDVEAEAT